MAITSLTVVRPALVQYLADRGYYPETEKQSALNPRYKIWNYPASVPIAEIIAEYYNGIEKQIPADIRTYLANNS